MGKWNIFRDIIFHVYLFLLFLIETNKYKLKNKYMKKNSKFWITKVNERNVQHFQFGLLTKSRLNYGILWPTNFGIKTA